VPPPVKQEAERSGIPVLQPDRPLGDVFLAGLRRLEPDLGVVVAYGHLLRPPVLSLPTQGMINVHASLLPRWRGAAPIQHAILAGDRETGISIMQMEAGLDSGPVLHRIATPLDAQETAGALTARLAELGASALVDALSLVAAGFAKPEPQGAIGMTLAPKIGRDTARLDWHRDAELLARQVRAFDPAPGAWATFGSAPLKLFEALATDQVGEPGLVLSAGDRLVLGTGRGALAVREVQPAGRTRLSVDHWVRGRGIAAGDRLE
jgi:methionyl-tRNA formyltransferase